MSARQNLSRATHFGLRDKGLLISSVVCRHGGCHLALLGREMARLLQANDSLPMKRIADPSRRCIPRRMSERCCIEVHTGCVSRCCRTGSEACRIFVRRFWGRWRAREAVGLHPISAPLLTSTCWWRCRENSIKPSTSPLLLPCVTITVCDDRSFVPPRFA